MREMIWEYVLITFWSIILALLALLMAPILDGLRRVIRAKIQRRIGPPIRQTIYDLEKLFRLKPILPSRSMFLIATPYIVFVLMLILSATIPLSYVPCLNKVFDLITFMYTLLLGTAFITIMGLIIPNLYSNAGSVRELLLISVFEVFVAFTIVGIAYSIGSLNLYRLPILYGYNLIRPSMFFLSLSLFILAYVESAYTPFDVGEAETEVIGGPYLEYSGRYYGLFLYSLLLKRYVLLSIPVSLVLVSPITDLLRPYVIQPLLSIISIALFIVFVFIVMSIYSAIEALYPRYRVDLTFKPLLLMSLIPLIGFIFGCLGW